MITTAPLHISPQQAEALSAFTREFDHAGPVRISVSETNIAGMVLLAELLADDGCVIRDRLLHKFGTITP